MSQVTRLIHAIDQGDAKASAELLPLVYDELRQLARQYMQQERAGQTLQATALVHEAYLRLVGDGDTQWNGRRHFFGAAAEAMRRILIERARKKKTVKHGGGRERVELDDVELPAIQFAIDAVDDVPALNRALERLESLDPEKAEVVKLLYFAGLNLDDAASAMGISRATVHRHWTFARAWLRDAMAQSGAES